MKYAWTARHKKHWPVSLGCDVLDVSTSGFFENMRRTVAEQPSVAGANKRISNEALLAQIRAIHAEVKQEYGWPKMCKELVARGIRIGKERVRRIMQEHGIKARGKRKFVVTTDSEHKLPIAANLLQRNFTAAAPNQVWTGDITYIATDEGWVVPSCSSGPVQPAGGGLEHVAAHAKLIGDGRTANGLVPACARAWSFTPTGAVNTAAMNSSRHWRARR